MHLPSRPFASFVFLISEEEHLDTSISGHFLCSGCTQGALRRTWLFVVYTNRMPEQHESVCAFAADTSRREEEPSTQEWEVGQPNEEVEDSQAAVLGVAVDLPSFHGC